MSTIVPFEALRPVPELASQVASPPYDVLNSHEAREEAADNPYSFLHVTKSEIDLPLNIDIHSPEVYEKAKENLQSFIEKGILIEEDKPCYYIYRLVMNGKSQTGLVAAASCEDYLKGIIKKHEFTRPDKEDDRVRHIETLNSQTGPVFLTYRANATPSASSETACANAVRSQRSSSSEYIQYGARWRIMNGSNGRSPWLWARSWIRSHMM